MRITVQLGVFGLLDGYLLLSVRSPLYLLPSSGIPSLFFVLGPNNLTDSKSLSYGKNVFFSLIVGLNIDFTL